MNLGLPVFGFRGHDERARAVRVVAIEQRTEVDLEQVTHGDGTLGGLVVRDRAVRACGHDAVERPVRRAVQSHQQFQLAGHLDLGLAQQWGGNQLGQGIGADPAGRSQGGQFGGILDLPQAARRDLHGHKFHAGHVVASPPPGGHGQQCGVEPDVAHSPFPHPAEQIRDESPSDDQIDTGCFGGGLRPVTAVRGQGCGVTSDEQGTVGAGEPAEVPHIRQVSHEEGAAVRRRHQFPQPIQACVHACASSASRANR